MMLLAFMLQAIRIAVPYLLAAAGGVMSERVGVIALGLEGLMLSGAFGAALGSYYGDSPWAGLLGALVAGALITTLLTVGAVVSAVKLPVAAGVLPVTALPARSLTPATKLPNTAVPLIVAAVLPSYTRLNTESPLIPTSRAPITSVSVALPL